MHGNDAGPLPNPPILEKLGRIQRRVESAYPSMPFLTIIGGMKARYLLLPMAGWCFWAIPGPLTAEPDDLPAPRVWRSEEGKSFSAADFEQQLEKLKAERAGLQTEWKALLKRSTEAMPKSDVEGDFQAQLREALRRLKERKSPASAPPREHPLDEHTIDPIAKHPGKEEQPAHPAPGDSHAETTVGPVDALSQAQTLFRTRHYEEALTSFRSVDLKGKKAEARAPVQYLMALCLLHLGKADEAVPMLREVANSRGDEKLAGYAQWQLDMYRWERELRDRLGQQRQRRLAVEQKL